MTEFTRSDLTDLGQISKHVKELTEMYERRMVVAVWNKGDTEPGAWIDNYPGDSDPTITFEPPATT